MFLSDVDIRKAIKEGYIKVEPFDEKNIQSGSLDLRLGNDFLVLNYHNSSGVIRLDEKQNYTKRKGRIIIPSRKFILGTTLEYLTISPHLVASVQGRSSIGRSGLFVQNAGWIDPGFEGNLTLEFFNSNDLPIELKPGLRICQVFFGYTKTPAEHPYHGKYKGQIGTTGSMSFEDREYKKRKS
jgi:dCTP deaminase